MSGLKYFDMKIEYDHMISKTSELEAENAELHTLTVLLSDLLSRTANALKGEPVDCLHSFHDLPEVAKGMRERATGLAWILKQIIEALPVNRDWLDPELERIAKGVLQAPKGKDDEMSILRKDC